MSTNARRGRPRLISIALLVVLLAGTLTATMMLRGLVRDQNRQLLHDRTAEAGLVLSSAFASVKPSLQVLGATYLADPGGGVAKALTSGFAAAQKDSTTAILSNDKGQLVVRIAAGPGMVANGPLTGARAALVNRAIGADDLVADVFSRSGSGKSSLAFAVALPNGPVVYQEIEVDPARLTDSRGNSPFSELGGALYVGRNAEPSKLLFSTAPLPLRGTVERQQIHIGADRWLLVATARHSLVGSFATTAPWVVFALGLLVSLVAFAAVDVLLRRRAHALALVEDRTATLRQTMAELETARTAAETANQAKSEFLSRMSHELRTPLNAVLGFAQVLERREITDSQQQSVTQIIKGGQHLLELINDVLDISRIETGNLTLSSEPVLVDDVVEDALELAAPLAAQHGITCNVVADDVSRYVLADRQRLKQVLLNLLSNAVKYNRAGGTVTISYEPRDELLRINVIDTGLGIPAGSRARLFEPFERLGAEHTNIEGTGVGLSLSRRLAEAMNGVLDVDSTEGEGSTFWIELQLIEGPVEHHRRTAPETSNASVEAPVDGPRHTLLYIEDNAANVKLIEHILDDRPDIHLITAMQGRLGIEFALQHHPAVILLDIHLPDIGGEVVLAELRANAETATTPIIVLTADTTDRQNARLLAAGATAYLTKPIDVGRLLEIVEQQLTESSRKPNGSRDATLTGPRR